MAGGRGGARGVSYPYVRCFPGSRACGGGFFGGCGGGGFAGVVVPGCGGRVSPPGVLAGKLADFLSRLPLGVAGSEPGGPVDRFLRGIGSWKVVEALVSSGDCPPEVLSLCAKYPYWPIAEKVAGNPRADAPVVEELARHPRREVRMSALLNFGKCSPSLVEGLLSDEESGVRRRAGEVRKHRGWLVAPRPAGT
jgi:hypothetical protein